MLDVQEQQTTTLRKLDEAPGLVVGAVWAAIFLVLFGARVAGLLLFALAVTGWVLWHRRRERPSAWSPARLGAGRDPARAVAPEPTRSRDRGTRSGR